MQTIGVLGGMGPQASIRFYQLLIGLSESVHGAKRNSDYPHVLLSNLPIPDLISDKQNEKKAVRMLTEEARILAEADADFLVIACNTMHLYIDECREAAGLPVLSMIETVKRRVLEQQHHRVGILGTSTTLRKGLYTTSLQENGVQVVVPVVGDQQRLDVIIKAIIAGSFTALREKELREIIHAIEKEEIDALILACTELPLVISQEYTSVPLYSSLHILAEEACKVMYEKKRKDRRKAPRSRKKTS
ncbi:MAG: amino acid racemase [Candidatus Peribacteraceae bacterium]|jgi:aspartate racemase